MNVKRLIPALCIFLLSVLLLCACAQSGEQYLPITPNGRTSGDTASGTAGDLSPSGETADTGDQSADTGIPGQTTETPGLPASETPTEPPTVPTDTPTVVPTTPETPSTETPVPDLSRALVPTELMARAEGGAWLELRNESDETIDLRLFALGIDGASYRVGGETLAPGQYFVFTFEAPLQTYGGLTVSYAGRYFADYTYANPSEHRSYLFDLGTESDSPSPGRDTPANAAPVEISEVMAINDCFPVYGKLEGYLEFYNPNGETVDLGDYYLSDNPANRMACRLPARTLGPLDRTAVTLDELTVLISAGGKTLYLTHSSGAAVGSFTYPALSSNEAYTVNGYAQPTPGYDNNDAGFRAYLSSRTPLVITEVITSNSKYLPKNDDTHDMVELKNVGKSPIDLSDYYLSDSRKKPQKYQLPAVTLNPGELYVVYCDKDMKVEGYAPFNLSKDGEFLQVTSADGRICDCFRVPYIPTDRSWGRTGDGELGYFETPTFGKANGQGKRELSGKPQASSESGFYKGSLTVSLSGAGKIYYTADGSLPTLQSSVYGGQPLTISKTTTIRAFMVEDGKLTGEDIAYDYIVDAPDLTLPVVKLTTAASDLEAIYADYSNKSLEIEGHIAMYVDGKQEWSLDCGVKLHGNYSRQYDKKSYHIKFRTRYGTSSLDYDLFGDGAITSFKDIVLRSGSQDRNVALMRDEFGVSVLRDYTDDLLLQNFRPVNVYVNDKYVGVYYIREKIGQQFVADHTGVSPESVGIVYCMMYSEWGDEGNWQEIRRFINNKDLTVQENYDYICEHIDIDSLIDYYIAYCWADNRDPGNTRIWRSTEGDGKWHFIMYDNDLGFGVYYQFAGASSVEFILGEYDNSSEANNALIYKLLRNKTFVDRFLHRLRVLCDTAFSDEVVNARIDRLVAAIDHDVQYSVYISYYSWNKTFVPDLRKYVTGRSRVLIDEFCDYLHLTDEERQKYFG